MKRYILRDTKPTISRESLFRTLRMPEDSDPEDIKNICKMLKDAAEIANPKAVYCVASITEKGTDFVIAEGVKLTSSLVRKNLDRVNRIIPYVVTCGTELEKWSTGFTNPLESYWADGIKLQYLAAVRKILEEKIKSIYFNVGDMSAMKPGSLEVWPLKEQAALFRLIGNVTEDIGVRLTDSFLMVPSKSASGFFFSSEVHYENCQYCPILDCPNRKAKFLQSLNS